MTTEETVDYIMDRALKKYFKTYPRLRSSQNPVGETDRFIVTLLQNVLNDAAQCTTNNVPKQQLEQDQLVQKIMDADDDDVSEIITRLNAAFRKKQGSA